jgi:hypothetical protein
MELHYKLQMASCTSPSRNGLSIVGGRRTMVDKVSQAAAAIMVEGVVAMANAVTVVVAVAVMEQIH